MTSKEPTTAEIREWLKGQYFTYQETEDNVKILLKRLEAAEATLQAVSELVDKWQQQNKNVRGNIEAAEAEGFNPGYDWRENNKSRSHCANELKAILEKENE